MRDGLWLQLDNKNYADLVVLTTYKIMSGKSYLGVDIVNKIYPKTLAVSVISNLKKAIF